MQYQELYPVRGYQSTVSQELLFGLAQNKIINQIKITWPNGKQTLLQNVAADQTLTLKQS